MLTSESLSTPINRVVLCIKFGSSATFSTRCVERMRIHWLFTQVSHNIHSICRRAVLNLKVANLLLLTGSRNELENGIKCQVSPPLNPTHPLVTMCILHKQNGGFISQRERTTVERYSIRSSRIVDNNYNVRAVVTHHGSQSEPKTS